MICAETKLKVADNSGATSVACIHVNGPTGSSVAFAGDVVIVSIKSCTPNGKVKKGEVYSAVIVRTKKPRRRKDGLVVRFDDNAVVLIDKKSFEPIGTRVLGPVAKEVRYVSSKIVSLAEEVF
jgi:large subunit ribosomal protein L14